MFISQYIHIQIFTPTHMYISDVLHVEISFNPVILILYITSLFLDKDPLHNGRLHEIVTSARLIAYTDIN